MSERGMQILGLPAQRKFVSAGCRAHFNTHKRLYICSFMAAQK